MTNSPVDRRGRIGCTSEFACSQQLDQHHDCDRVKDQEARCVDQRADQGGGDNGWVDSQLSRQKRHQGPNAVGPEANAQDRHRHHGGEGRRLPQHDPREEETEGSKQQSQEQTGQTFPHKNAGQVFGLDLAQGQAADDRADRLAAGVAAGADQ